MVFKNKKHEELNNERRIILGMIMLNASQFNEHMVMMVGAIPLTIYGRFKSRSIVGIIKKNQSQSLIIKFINNRYQQNFTIKDFKSGMDMIDYILDHESLSESRSH
jgi:hypothetical protein